MNFNTIVIALSTIFMLFGIGQVYEKIGKTAGDCHPPKEKYELRSFERGDCRYYPRKHYGDVP